ncbi:DUF1206 domain-containing protein [Pseudonocardia spinosispora]|uniref:DUF1206 domain-containing protein n=1 Tax=Pseudonocardia spinosispora TaxID=103441 RepID=UPI0004014477|nr:DUF1206 domain-containing protein [Pseudonocardia spinosispora]
MNAAEDAAESAERLAGSQPMRLGARAGLVANGLIHLLVAYLAIRVAFGDAERADQGGALQTIAGEPFGRLLLWAVTAGFAAVVIWRLREALSGFRYLTDESQRRQKRLFSAGQVVVFAVLTGLTARVAGGEPPGNGGQSGSAWLLQAPGGRWLLAAIGVGVVVTGGFMAFRGWQKAFLEDVDLIGAPALVSVLAERLGQFGAVAKALAIMIIGVLIDVAALKSEPARAQGMDVALKTLAAQPFGSVLLVVVALGLASYGLFCFFDARYHRV